MKTRVIQRRMERGSLSNIDILDNMQDICKHSIPEKYESNSDKIVIWPYNKYQLQPASYDVIPSCFVLSTQKGVLEKVYSSCTNEYCCKKCDPTKVDSECKDFIEKYVCIRPKDTVLIITREYIELPSHIAGNVYSRVSCVSKGFGNISTTIDPNWHGAILVAVSNQSNHPRKLMLQSSENSSSSVALASLVFSFLNKPTDKSSEKRQPCRVDILEQYYKGDCLFNKAFRGIQARKTQKTFKILRRKEDTDSTILEQWDKQIENIERIILGQAKIPKAESMRVKLRLFKQQYILQITWICLLLICIAIFIYLFVCHTSINDENSFYAMCMALLPILTSLLLAFKKY